MPEQEQCRQGTAAPGPIALVDDDPGVLRGVSRLLGTFGHATRTYESAPELLDALDHFEPECIIADLSMPGVSGLELQAELGRRRLVFPIVFLTGHGDIRSSVRAMRGGAVDFLVKPFVTAELMCALERAFERNRIVREFRAEADAFAKRLASLTPREREVYDEVVAGRLNKQIAGVLDIAEKTVKVHRARVMRKMATRSVAQLAGMAERFRSLNRRFNDVTD